MTDILDAGSLGRALTSNGLAFLRRAVDEMGSAGADTQRLSFAVVDLATAVEVLLKAHIAHGDDGWRDIFVDPGQPPAVLLSGVARTIELRRAADLVRARGVDTTTAGRIARAHVLARVRNRVVHFTAAGQDAAALQAQLAGAMDFVLWFLRDQFLGHGSSETRSLVKESIDWLSERLGPITALLGERMASLNAELANAETCLVCPRCGQDALVLTSEAEPTTCLFCLWRAPSGSEAAEEYVAVVFGTTQYEAFKDGGTWPITYCDLCGEEAFVEGVVDRRPLVITPAGGSGSLRAHWACFACGTTSPEGDLIHCSRCGEITADPQDGSVAMCGVCWSHLMSD